MSEINLPPISTLTPQLPKKPKLTPVQKDLLAGSLSGLMIVLTGHPLDTIKVRMQMLHTGFVNTCKNLVQKEGASALYKGISSPMYSTPLTTSLSFAAYEAANRLQGLRPEDKRTVPTALLSGAWSGFVYGSTITPVELLKTRLQMEGIGTNAKSMSVAIMARNIIREEGVSGLFRGLRMTLLRDVPSLAVQFGIYEGTKDMINRRFGESSLSSLAAGGFSVVLAWIVAYPQDTIKTKMQCSPVKLGAWQCTKDIYKSSGFGGFWKGISPCLLRAVVTGATRYIAYDKCQELVGKASK